MPIRAGNPAPFCRVKPISREGNTDLYIYINLLYLMAFLGMTYGSWVLAVVRLKISFQSRRYLRTSLDTAVSPQLTLTESEYDMLTLCHSDKSKFMGIVQTKQGLKLNKLHQKGFHHHAFL